MRSLKATTSITRLAVCVELGCLETAGELGQPDRQTVPLDVHVDVLVQELDLCESVHVDDELWSTTTRVTWQRMSRVAKLKLTSGSHSPR